jgi:3-deoxy-7-phosphoheptulonate synthase
MNVALDSGGWTPESWQPLPALQQPVYKDRDRLARVLGELSRLPPIVVSWEVDQLKQELAQAQRGERFLLQGGDCAEGFADCDSDTIARKLKILLQMSVVLLHGLKKPVIRVGRIAGQFAKPRSADTETRGGVTLPSYRGDLVNRAAFTAADREPDPDLLLRGYERAALTLNFVRALVDGGFADMHHPEYWDLGFLQHAKLRDAYRRIFDSISDSLDFYAAIAGSPVHEASQVRFYASHEGLHLLYEQAQTRYLKRRQRWYNLSTHMPWIGLRTAAPGGAHVEYFRGIANPIAVKVDAETEGETLVELARILNPDDEPGRLTLIHRFGAGRIGAALPPMIRALREAGRQVLWVADPMHGNTESTPQGIKTRRFENILAEVEAAFRIHADCGSILGGVHFELTGDDVTECTGGARGLGDGDLARAYHTSVDPRLNYEQALELAMLIGRQRPEHK